MKKRIIYLVIVFLFLTGCTCEYNLTLEKDIFSEEVILNGNSEEVSLFNQKWQIPTNKEIYNNLSGDPNSHIDIESDIYNYKLSGNKLLFSYDFSIYDLNNSAAISNCYATATINSFQDRIVLSTSSEVICFDRYPDMESLVINITVDRPVISHNASYKAGNKYTWKINKDNLSNSPINMILSNEEDINDNSNIEDDKQDIINENKEDYTLYIFCGILLIILLLGYLIVNKIKNREDDMSD